MSGPLPTHAVWPETALRALVEETATTFGDEFFRTLVRQLALALRVDHALVGEYVGPNRVRMLAWWVNGSYEDAREYELPGTPCEGVVSGQLCFFARDVQRLFPEDRFLVDEGVEGYLGAPLIDTDGTTVGLLAVTSKQPLVDSEEMRDLVRVFAARSAVELQRLRALRELERSEERMRSMADALPVLIADVGHDGRFRFANRAFAEWFGREREDIEDMSVPDLLGVVDFDRVRECFDGALAGLATSFEHKIDFPGAGSKLVRVMLTPQRDVDRPGFYVLVLDLSERHEAEKRSRFDERRLRQVMDLVPHMIFAKDRNGHFLLANRAVAEAYGTTVEQLVGVAHERVHGDVGEVAHMLADDQQVIDSGKPKYNPEETFTDSSGRTRLFQTTKVPFEEALTGERAMLGVAIDITDQRKAEEERRRFERKLQHAQKLESLGVLAGGIAHDINNLLMGILGNAGLVLRALPLESRGRERVEEIRHAGERLAELADLMLAYSGKGRFLDEPVDLNQLVRATLPLLEASLSKKTELSVELADSVPPVQGDRAQLQQVVMNLIVNASEALDESGGRVSVRTGVVDAALAPTWDVDYRADGEAERVFFEVADTGCGMDDDTRARVFEPFFTTKVSGRGLGMSAVLGIVRGHTGTLRVDSRPGEGTTFCVTFPAGEVLAEDAPVATELEQGWRATGTVLVVDDDDISRIVAAHILEELGFTVLQAEDGHEGVRQFRANTDEVRLVLLDMMMPGLDGAETIRELRAVREDVQVVLTSGYSEQEAAGAFAGHPPDAFLKKPYSPERLGAVLRGVLRAEGPDA